MPSNNPNQTIPTSLAPVIPSFTPQIQSPAFSNPINEVIVPVIYPTGARTLTPSDLNSGFVIQAANTAQTDTLPTAASLVPLIPGANLNTAIFFTIRNTGSATLTIAVGAGGTANSGDTLTIATLNQRAFMLIVTNLGDALGVGATYTLYSLGALTF